MTAIQTPTPATPTSTRSTDARYPPRRAEVVSVRAQRSATLPFLRKRKITIPCHSADSPVAGRPAIGPVFVPPGAAERDLVAPANCHRTATRQGHTPQAASRLVDGPLPSDRVGGPENEPTEGVADGVEVVVLG